MRTFDPIGDADRHHAAAEKSYDEHHPEPDPSDPLALTCPRCGFPVGRVDCDVLGWFVSGTYGDPSGRSHHTRESAEKRAMGWHDEHCMGGEA